MNDAAHTLVRIADTALTLADPTDDLRGRKVVDRNGDEVGKVEGLIIDEGERKARFLEVGAGGFLGLGETKRLVPVEAISQVHEDVVHISRERELVVGAPVYDPEVVPDPLYFEDMYGYYNYPPFWGPGRFGR